jgi:hypothetical protein
MVVIATGVLTSIGVGVYVVVGMATGIAYILGDDDDPNVTRERTGNHNARRLLVFALCWPITLMLIIGRRSLATDRPPDTRDALRADAAEAIARCERLSSEQRTVLTADELRQADAVVECHEAALAHQAAPSPETHVRLLAAVVAWETYCGPTASESQRHTYAELRSRLEQSSVGS